MEQSEKGKSTRKHTSTFRIVVISSEQFGSAITECDTPALEYDSESCPQWDEDFFPQCLIPHDFVFNELNSLIKKRLLAGIIHYQDVKKE